MAKGIIGLLAVAAVGGIAFAVSRSASASSEAPLETVTGQSGTVYGVRLKSATDTVQGRQLTFEVFDAAGLILEYAQIQGDNSSRILVLTPDAEHEPGDAMWINAVNDFGIFSIPGSMLQ